MNERGRSVLFISPQPFFQWRGSPIRVRFDLKALGELGYRIDLLTLPFGEDPRLPRVRIVRVPNPFFIQDIPIGPSIWKVAFGLMLLCKALKMASRDRYDFVHCVEDAGIIGAILRRTHGCRFTYEKHSDVSSYHNGPVRGFILRTYQKVEAIAIRKSDAVIVGPGVLEVVRNIAPKANTHVVYSIPSSSVEAAPERIANLRDRIARSTNDILITYVGSFAAYQGIDLLIRAIPFVVAEHPNARFMIIGGTDREIAQFRKRLTAVNVESCVVLPGKIHPDETPHYLGASDILLSPRLAGRTNPIKIFDYLKAGKPIVATDHPSNRRILDETTSVFTGATPECFASGVIKLVRDRKLRQRLSQNGRRIIEERYNYDDFKRRLASCYDSLERSAVDHRA